MEANYREVWTTEFLPRLPQNLAHSSSDDSYTREVMGLFQDNKSDEFSKYDSAPTFDNNLNTFNSI
jgi:hypothetical protein